MEKGTTYIVRPFIDPANRLGQGRAHLGRVPPVVGRPGVVFVGRTDEGPVLHPGHVAGVRVGPVAVGPLGLGELGEGAVVHQQLAEPVVLVGRTVAPLDAVGGGEGRHLLHPVERAWRSWWGACRGRFLLGTAGSARPPPCGAGGTGRQRPMVGMEPWPPPNHGPRPTSPAGRMRPSGASPIVCGRRSGPPPPGRCGSATTPPWWPPPGPPGAVHRRRRGRGPRRPLAGRPRRPGLEGADRRGQRHRRHGGPTRARPGHLVPAAGHRPRPPGRRGGRGLGGLGLPGGRRRPLDGRPGGGLGGGRPAPSRATGRRSRAGPGPGDRLLVTGPARRLGRRAAACCGPAGRATRRRPRAWSLPTAGPGPGWPRARRPAGPGPRP